MKTASPPSLRQAAKLSEASERHSFGRRQLAESREKAWLFLFDEFNGDFLKGSHMAVQHLTEEELDALRQFDTCVVANAIERFNLRLRNTGFTGASIRCVFPDAPLMLGYAVTARLRCGEPPMRGGVFHDRSDLWNSILAVPAPRILVLEDMDDPPGQGAFVGSVHGSVLKALGCVGYLTNGAVRELPSVRTMGIQLFAGSLAVSRAYAHIFELGAEVRIGGMDVSPGDLLHGDLHGVINVPLQAAAQIPQVAAEMQRAERKVIEFSRSSSFSVSQLNEVLKATD